MLEEVHSNINNQEHDTDTGIMMSKTASFGLQFRKYIVINAKTKWDGCWECSSPEGPNKNIKPETTQDMEHSVLYNVPNTQKSWTIP